jgi:2-phosphosulfolactate phosphatase
VIDVAFTGADVRACDVAVVIDVLRATSTITQALAAGYRRVLCVESLDTALSLRAPGRVLAGERDCVAPPGFDQGNSPREVVPPRGDELVLTTSNGTPAILLAAQVAPAVLLGCVMNSAAVTAAILGLGDPDEISVGLVCSGGAGRPCVEDLYAAGSIASGLGGRRSDSALIAEALFRHYATPAEALQAASHAQILSERGLADDVDLCAEMSTLTTVPAVATVDARIAVVIDSANVREAKVVAA